MVWYFLLIGILIWFMLDIYSIIKGKPTRKSAFKMCINNLIYQLLGFAIIINIILIFILAIAGNQVLAKSTNVDVLVISNGLSVIFEGIMISFMIIVVLDALNAVVRKKKLQIISIYFNWTNKLEKEGFFKYTDEEKAYNKEQDIKSKEQLRKWFPFIKKLDKKKV